MKTFLTVLCIALNLGIAGVFLLPDFVRLAQDLWRRFRCFSIYAQIFVLVITVNFVRFGGSKETNTQSRSSSAVTAGEPTRGSTAYLNFDGGVNLPNAATLGEDHTTTPGERRAGYVITEILANSTPFWIDPASTPGLYYPTEWNSSNALARHDDTIWINPTNWNTVVDLIGTTRVDSIYWDTRTALGFNAPAPGITHTNPACAGSFIGSLWGSHSFIPSLGSRAWIALSESNVVFGLSDIFVGRATNQPASVQTLYRAPRWNQSRGNDIIVSYLLSSNTVASGSLTNYAVVLGNQSGVEHLGFGSNAPPQSFTLTFTGFGYNPVTDTNSADYASSDADHDGISDDDELMIYHSDMWNSDTDFDGLTDYEEVILGSDMSQRDTDFDGLVDGSDPNPLTPDTIDSDQDRILDVWELFFFGTLDAVSDLDADSSTSGVTDGIAMLSGIDPAFSVCAVTTSHGEHRLSWTDLADATNYIAMITCGSSTNWSCATNICSLSITGDFTAAQHTLSVTAHCASTRLKHSASQTFRQPTEPNLTVWRISDPIALESATADTIVLERSFTINRVREWQQYYISADYQSAAGWELDGMNLHWSDNTSAEGSTNASPLADSLLLNTGAGALTLNLRFTTDRAGLVKSTQPLYLIEWSPSVTIDTNAVLIADGDDMAMVLITDQDSAPTGAGFSVNTGGRPSNAELTDDQRKLLNDPFGDGGSSFTAQTDATGLIIGGAFNAGESGSTSITAPGGGAAPGAEGGEGGAAQGDPGADGQGAFTLWRIAPAILDFSRDNYGGLGGHSEYGVPGSDQYPFDTACLRKQLLYAYHYPTNDYQGGGYAGGGVEVSLGLAQEEEQNFTITINDVEGATYSWQEADKRANITVAFGTNEVWSGSRERMDMTDRSSGYWGDGPPADLTVEDDACGCDDGCASGDCSNNDGPDLGSLKFRLSLGQSGYQQSGGFLWFKTETMPTAITSELFNFTALPSVSVTSNNNALSCIDNVAVNGRRIDVSSITGGVRFDIYRYDRSPTAVSEGSWEVTSSGSSVSFIGKDSNGNPLRHLTYSFDEAPASGHLWGRWDDAWTETDHLTGRERVLYEKRHEFLPKSQISVKDSSGNLHHAVLNFMTTVGMGTASVKRVSDRYEHGKYGAGWSQSSYHYHTDTLNPRVNGKLKLQSNDDTSWEYYLWDASGREALRVTSVDGCARPAYLDSDCPNFNFNPAGSYANLNARITQHDYTTHAGDSTNWHDAVQSRTVTEWHVNNGAPALTGRTWHKYTRGETNILGETYAVITHTAIRAANPGEAINDAANKISIDTSFLDTYCGSLHLDGRPLYRKDEDGSTTTWEYDLDGTIGELAVTTHNGTTTSPQGLSGKSTYEVERTDLYYGHTLSRATWLYIDGANDAPLNAEWNDYDDKGRLLSTEYSDGTAMINEWSCCHLLQSIDRSGIITQYPMETNRLHSETLVISPGLLPGAAGRYPVSGSYVDLLGRTTNSYSAGQSTITAYPEYSSHLRVTTDPLGAVTTNQTSLVWDAAVRKYYIIEATTRAGVKTTTRRLANGEPVTTTEWTDSVSGETLKRMTKTQSETQSNGCEQRTSYVKYDDGNWLTQSETVTDFLGRTVSNSRAGVGGVMLTTSNVYNNAGLVVQTISHDGSSMVYGYNELNERTATIRVAAGQTLDFNAQSFILDAVIAIDKYLINFTTERTENTEGEWWKCVASVSYRPGENALTTSVQRVQFTGLTLECNSRTISKDVDGNTIMSTESLNPGNVTKTAVSVDTTFWTTNIAYFVAGYEVSSTSSLGNYTTHTYDGYARKILTTNYANDRELKSVVGYHDDGSVASIGEVTSSGTNTTSYSVRQPVADESGAYAITVTDPQGHQTVNYYSGDGELYRSEGATYPVAYAKNSAGQMEQLHTWRDESGNPDITHWYYDPFTGVVTNKLYADGKGTAYTYLADGRIASRRWARDITTAYGYIDTAAGSIRTTEYNDLTPKVTNTYNLAGQLLCVLDGTGTTTFGYNAKGRQVAVTNALAIITRSYDSYGRYSQCVLDPVYPGYPSLIIDYDYDILNRLDKVTAIIGTETNTFTYSYIPGTTLISGYTVLTSSTPSTILTVLRSYEASRNFITAITNSVGTVPSVVSSFIYSTDSTGKRTARSDYYNGSTVNNTFNFNARGETTNAVVNSDAYNYNFDGIGNRTTSSVNSVFSTYTANQLNQYTSVSSVPSVVNPGYDPDGNLTYDGTEWHHGYNGENRLITSSNEVTGVYITYAYDYQNRRSSMTTLTQDPFSSLTTKYIWDGWNIAAEIVIDEVNPTTNITYYTWGLDLSGTLQGAGGVGGLLAATISTPSTTSTYYALADANGNVTEYVDEMGTVKAHYEYNACGEITALSGTMKDDFTHRFSTKPYDPETRLVQYQLRPYSPKFCAFLQRDLAEENGGIRLVGMLDNDCINEIDAFGLWKIKHNVKQAYAFATRENNEYISELASETGFSVMDVLGWARKNANGERFSSLDQLNRACEVCIPNRLIVLLPDIVNKGAWWNLWQRMKHGWSKNLRNSLIMIGNRYEANGFMVDTMDFAGNGPSSSTQNPVAGKIDWPTMGFLAGGHGSPPLKIFSDHFPRAGEIVLNDNIDMLEPRDFNSTTRGYQFNTVLVFGCWAGKNSWHNLASPVPASRVYISPPRPTTLLDFPYWFNPPTWE